MTHPSSHDALLIFIRNPELGKVKTRLAADLGDEEALRIYRLLLDHTREVAQSVEVHRYLFYSDFIAADDGWPASAFDKQLQPSGDLGERMLTAFRTALEHHESAVIVGSDCPGLTPEILQTAFGQLRLNDFVIGPALDGGYYLLGMRTLAPALFRDMTWSTDGVFSETTRRMQEMKASCYVLPALSDIDRAEDWERFGRQQQQI